MINLKKTTRKSLLPDIIITCITLFIVLYSSYQNWKTNQETIVQTEMAINNEADLAVLDINKRLKYLMETGQNFADALTNGQIPYANVEHQAEQVMIKNRTDDAPSKFYNFSVSFAKGAYDVNQPNQLANWIYIADKKTGQVKSLKRDYDYSIDDKTSKTSWFVKAAVDKKPFWQQPKYADVSNNFLVAYSIPFFTSPKKDKVAGVVAVGFSTDELKSLMYQQDYRKTGYGMVFSDEGHLVYHPNDLMPLAEVSKHYEYFKNEFDFINQIRQDRKVNKDIQSYRLPKTHEKAWVLFKNISASNWSYQIVFLESELGIQQKTLETRLYLLVSLIAFSIVLAFIVFIRHYKKINDLWYFSTIITAAFVIGTAFLWHNADLKEIELPPHTEKIESSKDIAEYKKSQDEFLDAMHKKQRFYIPTGVFVKAAEFEGSNNVLIAGYIWQKYQLDNSLPPNVIPEDFCSMATDKIPKEKSIMLIEAFEDQDKTNLSCNDATYKEVVDHTVTIGWYFNVKLRQSFDYSSFPLDKNIIWLRMHPTSHTDYIVLTPDFTSYPYIYGKFLMGVDSENFVLPSWNVFATFYGHLKATLNSNFGMDNYKGQVSQELIFNIAIKRVFLDTIFSTVVPIFIIYLILFVLLFGTLDDLLAVLAINAGLLFSVALWHSGLRASLSSTGITYFETFYFVCYFSISLVCINSVLLACRYEMILLHYKDNLFSKLIFLPLVSAITFVITICMLF